MARHAHEARYVAGGPFTNMFVFFMSDLMKAANPFLVRLPREKHEQYLTDIMRELKKLSRTETDTNADDVVARFKYGLIVAFARKI